MGRWTLDEHGCIYDDAGCFARLTPNKAERLASRHNADIDALTAERDELQRRCKSITDALTDLAGNPHAMLDAHEVLCVIAIAEGREG